jgi:transcriptional antiterminator NusG
VVTEQSDTTENTATTPPPKGEDRHWYAVHTYSGYENKVKTHLEARIQAQGLRDKIARVVVPMEEETEIKNGQRRTVQRKVFPGYVLVEMVMDDETWHVVRNVPGVTSFVGAGDGPGNLIRPVALQDSEVKGILKEASKTEEKPKAKIAYTVGQHVRVIDGPFTDFIGSVSEIHPDRNKVVVVVTFFGRETPVTLDFLQVEKV